MSQKEDKGKVGAIVRGRRREADGERKRNEHWVGHQALALRLRRPGLPEEVQRDTLTVHLLWAAYSACLPCPHGVCHLDKEPEFQ